MNYFLGIFPGSETSSQLTKLSQEYSKVFSSQGIPISLVKPGMHHITVLYLGKSFSMIDRTKMKLKFRNYEPKAFKISIESVKLGLSSKYRELLYFQISDGSDKLREMVSTLSKRLGVKREKVFIPHITSGRVKKDLYDEEYKNLSSQIAGLNNKHFNSDEISFIPQKLELIESDYTNYETLQEYQFSK